jgi:hypothetical protein
MEYMVVATLIGAGYLWQQHNVPLLDTDADQGIQMHQTPYESNHVRQTRRMVQNRAKAHVPKTRKAIDSARYNEEMIMSLSGNAIPKSQFKHQNMKPFFGSKMTQNMNLNQNKALLETFTGTAPLPPKKEQAPMFSPMPEEPFGRNILQDIQKQRGRFNPSSNKQNILPFEQQQVSHAGSYSDYERQRMLPKNVDELRGKMNQKSVYEGRLIPGKAVVDDRTLLPEMFKHREENDVENKYILKTTGAYTKQEQQPEVILRNTENKEQHFSYMGNAAPQNEKMGTLSAKASATRRKQLKGLNVTNAVSAGKWQADNGLSDYGKQSIRPAEMNVTEKKSSISNLVTSVKALIAPFQSEVLPTIREDYEENKHSGVLTGPTKLTQYDPTDVARITKRQQTSNNSYTGTAGSKNMKPSVGNIENASFNELKEYLETNRAPTQTGVKLMAGQETVNMTRETSSYAPLQSAGITKAPSFVPVQDNSVHTQKRNHYSDSRTQLDTSVIDALKENPYSNPITNILK